MKGLERRINQNREENQHDPEFFNRLTPPSIEQTALTKEWILPYEELIVEDVRKIREEVDRTLSKNAKTRTTEKSGDRKYPEGFCKEIRNEVLKRMQNGMLDSSYPGLQAIKAFVRQGGMIQGFWGIDKQMYFQNAIQIGDSILDVANDTVDHTKDPIVFYRSVAEAPIKRIESFEEFADVAESYWGFQVYPNIYLPSVAPVFPVIVVDPGSNHKDRTDRIRLEYSAADLYYKNMFTIDKENHLFSLSSDFLFKGKYSEKRLPAALEEALFSSPPLKALQRRRPDLFRTTADPEEARQEIAHFHIDRKAPDEERQKVFTKLRADAINILKYGGQLTEYVLARKRN